MEPVENNLRFPGQYFDAETGRHYNRFRYYDPLIGQFVQPDPIGLLGGYNLYQYVPNPMGWVDLMGLTKDCAGEYLAKKAPLQVTPGTRVLEGQYINDLGRVEPWRAHYDEYGRLIGRTDFNAGNKTAGIPDIHYHTYEWGPGKTPLETGSHIPGEFQP